MKRTTADGGWPLPPIFDVLAVLVLDGSGGTVYAGTGVDALAEGDLDDEADVLDALVHPDDAHSVATVVLDVLDGAASARRISFRSRLNLDRRFDLVLAGAGSDDREGSGDGSTGEGGAAVGVLTDATDRVRDRQALAGLGDLLDAVLDATTRADLCRAFLEWGRRLPNTNFTPYLYDTDEGRLSPATLGADEESGFASEGPADAGPADEESTGDESAVEESTGGQVPEAIRSVYRTGTARVVHGAGADRHRVALPVGDHGVLVAETGAGSGVDDQLIEAFRPLAALLGLGLDRLGYAESLAVAREVARETRDAHRRLQKLANTVRRAEDRILRADTPQAIHEALCEELTATDLFAFAWVGEVDFQNDRLVPQAWAGEGRPYVDNIDLEMETAEAGTAPPSVTAAVTRKARHVTDVASGVKTAPWRREALANGFQSAMAVPIGDDEGLLGILSVYTREAGGLDDEIRLALVHLGAVAGYATNALELRRAFFGATSVEVKLHVPATETALGRFAREIDAELEVLSVVPREDGAARLFFTVDSAPETVLDDAEETPGVGDVTHHADRAQVPVFETTITDQTLLRAVTSHGAILSAASADAEGLWLTVKLGQNVEVRAYVESVRAEFPDTEIVARRIREEPVEASHRLRADYEEQLSERQREVFEAAYFGGYFNWPRDRTGSEIADSIGIAQPTFSRHLRAAERKLAALLFEGTG